MKSRRFPIKLPYIFEKWLIFWAYTKDVTKTQLAQNIIQARIEANRGDVERILEEIAADRGISIEDLKTEIMAEHPDVKPEDD